MNRQCGFEEQVAAAATTDTLGQELQAHVDTCPVCAEVLWLTRALAPTEEIPLPPAGLIYWKAELAARRDRAEQALRPTRVMQSAALGVLFALVAAAAVVSGSVLLIGAAAVAIVAALAALTWIARSA